MEGCFVVFFFFLVEQVGRCLVTHWRKSLWSNLKKKRKKKIYIEVQGRIIGRSVPLPKEERKEERRKNNSFLPPNCHLLSYLVLKKTIIIMIFVSS